MRAPHPDAFGVYKRQRRSGSAREQYISASLETTLFPFAKCFTAPSYKNFVALVSGWILSSGRRSISRVIQVAGGPSRAKHFSSLYRFFSRARWCPDHLGQVLFQLLLPRLPLEIEALVDDTLCHRSGPHIFGGGMHHDASRSTYGRGIDKRAFFSFGHNWVVLALRVPLPWDEARGIAIPILVRLYRSKRTCPQSGYRKRTELAADLVQLLESWIPASHRLCLAGDAEYACRTLVPRLSKSTNFVGPMHMDAALYEVPGPYTGHGRPRLKGRRLCTPRQLADRGDIPWRRRTVTIYGRQVEVLTKTLECLWYKVAGARQVLLVLTRDPSGRMSDRAYFSTDAGIAPELLLQRFSRRWMIEVCFRDAKQLLGLEDPQNGWWRRRTKARRSRKRPGPQAHRSRGSAAVLRTLPIVFTSYAVVVLWYLEHGDHAKDVRRARKRAPWYRSKGKPSFADMLAACRADTWAERLLEDPPKPRDREKLREQLWGLLRSA